jgi:ABC-type branched-subunit amino acid transport system substrate-binding protein
MPPLARVLALVLVALLLTTAFPPPAPAAEDVKIALVAPLSGRWARQGQLKKMGAEMAIEEINSQGGIKALGGAKIVLREADAGDSVEKAVSAAQRVLTREKISAGIGSWLSSFTLGVTEVAERLQVPWLSLSYADSITERGFKYTFQTSPVSSLQAEQALELVSDLAKKNNRPIKKAAIVGDNTAASMFFYKPLREKLLAAKGIELVVDDVWTPPLADATSIVQKLRSAQADIVFYGATNFPDSIQVLQKVKEFGVKSPIQGVGAWLVTPSDEGPGGARQEVRPADRRALHDPGPAVHLRPRVAHQGGDRAGEVGGPQGDPRRPRQDRPHVGPGRELALSQPDQVRRARAQGGCGADHRAVAGRRALHGGADRGRHAAGHLAELARARARGPRPG